MVYIAARPASLRRLPFDFRSANTMQKFVPLLLLFALTSCENTIKLQPIVVVPQVKIFFGPLSPSTSKFPPIIELLVQRLQTQFSTYVYEDLSRPPTYEKPVYTLSPEEEATATEPLVAAESSTPKFNAVDNETEVQTEEEGVIEENVVHPIHYGTLVVYLKKNSTTKAERVIPSMPNMEKFGEKNTPILTAVLDVKLIVPPNSVNHTRANNST